VALARAALPLGDRRPPLPFGSFITISLPHTVLAARAAVGATGGRPPHAHGVTVALARAALLLGNRRSPLPFGSFITISLPFIEGFFSSQKTTLPGLTQKGHNGRK